MGIDPPSFGGKERGHGGGSGGFRGAAADEQEKKMVMEFLERWKKFDWTSELDGERSHACTALDFFLREVFRKKRALVEVGRNERFPKPNRLGVPFFMGGLDDDLEIEIVGRMLPEAMADLRPHLFWVCFFECICLWLP